MDKCVTHHEACACREAEMARDRALLASLEEFAEAVRRLSSDAEMSVPKDTMWDQLTMIRGGLRSVLAKLDAAKEGGE